MLAPEKRRVESLLGGFGFALLRFDAGGYVAVAVRFAMTMRNPLVAVRRRDFDWPAVAFQAGLDHPRPTAGIRYRRIYVFGYRFRPLARGHGLHDLVALG